MANKKTTKVITSAIEGIIHLFKIVYGVVFFIAVIYLNLLLFVLPNLLGTTPHIAGALAYIFLIPAIVYFDFKLYLSIRNYFKN